jgi:hypothetical protein
MTLRGLHDRLFRFVAAMPVQPHVRILSGGCGLFSDVFMALNGVQRCIKYGLTGSVYWGHRSLYFDPKIGGNAYAYFFSGGSFEASRAHVAKGLSLPYIPSGDVYDGSDDPKPRRHMKRLIDQFAAPRDDIVEEVEAFRRSELQGAQLLGVHVRRTDVAAGFESRPSQPISNFVAEASNWLAANENGLIFLASDDADVVREFRARFGGKVVYQDAMRSSNGISIHGHFDAGLPGSPYRKGREAVIDALILSRCHFLIRCFSFLTCYSLCINPDLDFTDLDIKNLGYVRTRWLHK